MTSSSEQCLPNLSLRALPVIVCVIFASKRSVGVEAPSATRGLAMTCTGFSRLYTIRLDETRAEIHFRSAEKCLLFSLITHILENSILSSCRTRILNPRRRLRGIDDFLCCACRSKAFCLQREISTAEQLLCYTCMSLTFMVHAVY